MRLLLGIAIAVCLVGVYMISPSMERDGDPRKIIGGATAICKDGMLSTSESRRGTCSGHGGVKEWIK